MQTAPSLHRNQAECLSYTLGASFAHSSMSMSPTVVLSVTLPLGGGSKLYTLDILLLLLLLLLLPETVECPAAPLVQTQDTPTTSSRARSEHLLVDASCEKSKHHDHQPMQSAKAATRQPLLLPPD